MYRIFFRFYWPPGETPEHSFYFDTERGPHDFMGGFWIDENYEFTNGSDCKYWIPSSQVFLVEKLHPIK